jgi:hypothetical protein
MSAIVTIPFADNELMTVEVLPALGRSRPCCQSQYRGGMTRNELTDAQWERLQPLLPPQRPRTGRPAQEHRRILNGKQSVIRIQDTPARGSLAVDGL